MESTDQPNSIYHIQSIHMYPLQSSDIQDSLPFNLLSGETVLHLGNSADGLIFFTNYRLYMQNNDNQYHIPLGIIESVEIRELFYLQLFCKDSRTYRCTFENNESALDWYDRVNKAVEPPTQVEQLFAFYHYVWAKENGSEEATIRIASQTKFLNHKEMFENEMARLQFQGDSWRITRANENYKICPTYPPYLLVPSCINDEMLESVAKFRSSRRIPIAVWRHTKNGAVIARCSQPEVGWFGWRSSEDEDLLKAISEACNFDRNHRTSSTSDKDSILSHSPGSFNSDESLQITGEVVQHEKKLLIMDARSYTTAVANRARGGGCECPEYYPNCEIQFMNLANIHSIRKSFHALRQLCMSSAEQPNWFSLLEGTRWLLHMSGLLKSAVILATAVERDGRPVLVHCSDGWDRTPQIVALAELLLDPYYRTIDGFRILIEREWLAFGHKFADRCGHSGGSEDLNERCPVFLQWLDCVHQLMHQFPVSFEFSQNYLIKLVQHTYSNLYGTFLCNTQKQRSRIVHGKTFSVWELLASANFKNHLYTPIHSMMTCGSRVLWPKTNVRDLRLWSEVYLDSIDANFMPDEFSINGCPGQLSTKHSLNMSKTRSHGDLMNAELCPNSYSSRRCSDPSINRELMMPGDQSTIYMDNNEDTSTTKKPSSSPEPVPDNGPDFLPSDMEDNYDCNQDCIFNSNTSPASNLTDDQVDGLATGSKRNEIIKDDFKIDDSEMNGGSEEVEENDDSTSQDFLRKNRSSSSLYVDNELNGVSVENELCEPLGTFLDLERSVETSTETLVSDHRHIPGCYSNGDFRVRNTNKNRLDEILRHKYKCRIGNCQLGVDGLVLVRSPIQERLDQIMEEYRRKIEMLEKELHSSRQILMRQACNKCNHAEEGKPDDTGSVIGSVYSAGEGPVSAGESLRSDLSWVDIEEGTVAECQGTLWVPDHAVNKCTGCDTEFWLGRRRHHCRKCGRIFCADCSEHATPLPSEQLYNPVRVCTGCYLELSRTGPSSLSPVSTLSTSLPDSCKTLSAEPHECQRIGRQIAASSN
ncbi:hypothetical protein ABEB36_006281 [Hypothenemus hampei]|uniref:Lateral signaling target protein 2 homolog n=1 Tax=Hypothenemus hampei TaxID=57062 RepID=A0ABD1EQ06_HYPHA